jgi:hypothetical protein
MAKEISVNQEGEPSLNMYGVGFSPTPLSDSTDLEDSKTGASSLAVKTVNDDLTQLAASVAGQITTALNVKITSGTADLVAGTTPLATGTLHIVYE